MSENGVERDLETQGDTVIIIIGFNENIPGRSERLKLDELMRSGIKGSVCGVSRPQIRVIEQLSDDERVKLGSSTNFAMKGIIQESDGTDGPYKIEPDKIESNVKKVFKQAGYKVTSSTRMVV